MSPGRLVGMFGVLAVSTFAAWGAGIADDMTHPGEAGLDQEYLADESGAVPEARETEAREGTGGSSTRDLAETSNQDSPRLSELPEKLSQCSKVLSEVPVGSITTPFCQGRPTGC